jgi:hypothetical protein
VTTAREARRVSKAKLKPAEQVKVWVRAGGRCVLCHDYLLEGRLTGLGVALGELAHIVGQKSTPGSPRGAYKLDPARRDDADNVLLACPSCHSEIDKKLIAGILDVDRLRALKAAHEKHIRHVTGLPRDTGTLVLRLLGKLRGDPVDVTRATATLAVTADGRFPSFELDRNNEGVEIDLRDLPGEDNPDQTYYATATKVIDEVMLHKLHDAVAAGDARHVSVFAMARVPLLVYLGAKLDDNFTVETYQRHRASQSWEWDPTAPTELFTSQIDDLADATEAALVINVSGTVDTKAIPDDVAALTRIVVGPVNAPTPDILRSRSSLNEVTKALREINANLDAHKQTLRRLHVFGAMPPAVAIELGRLHDPHIHPSLVLYSLDEGSYRFAMEI